MTALKKVIIGGFKSIRDRTEIPIAPLTFFFGPNSAGKSVVAAAVRSLVELIKEVPRDSYFLVGVGRPPVYRDNRAHLSPDRLAPSDVVLGAELDDFPALGPKEEVVLSGAEISGKALFWALDGASVEMEVAENYSGPGEDKLRFSKCILRVDGQDLFRFTNRDLDAQGKPVQVIQSKSKKTEKAEVWRPLGKISINTRHSLWSVYALNSAANLSRIDATANTDEARVNRQYLNLLLSEVRDFAGTVRSPFLKQIVRLDGDFLNINTAVGFFSAEPWSPISLAVTNNESIDFSTLWRRTGAEFSPAALSEHTDYIWRVNAILEAVSQLCKSVLGVMTSHLQLNQVEGDRKILKPADVSHSSPLIYSSYLTDGAWRDNDRSSMRQYAFWLGLKSSGEALLPKEYTDSIFNRSDFVNDILSKGLFGGRAYQVKAETWHIRTECVSMRQPKSYYMERQDEDVLTSNLYLEDEQGRKIDFSEVGSGISYVFPILTSLAIARTSWIAQPELHLHPSAQCELGDVFLRALNNGHYAVVETHSEHILLRVLKRIRQTTKQSEIDKELKCPPEAVCVLYFDPQEDGSTSVRQLRVTRLGDFKDRWPDGFFEERGRELFDE